MNLQAKWHVLSTHLMRDKGLSDVLGNKLPFRIWDHSFFDILVFKGVKNPHIFWTKYVQTYKKILLAKAKPPPFSLSKVIFLSSLLKSTLWIVEFLQISLFDWRKLDFIQGILSHNLQNCCDLTLQIYKNLPSFQTFLEMSNHTNSKFWCWMTAKNSFAVEKVTRKLYAYFLDSRW